MTVNKEVNIMINFITGKAQTVESITKKLRDGLQKTVTTFDKFNNRVSESTTFKPFTDSQKAAIAETKKFNNMAKKFGFGDVMRMSLPDFKKFNESNRNFNNYGARFANTTRKMTHGLRGFRMEMLGVMFFGMAIQRFFMGMLQPAMDLVGIFDLFNIVLGVVFLPIALQMLDLLLPLFQWFMDLSTPVKELIGYFVLFGAGIGTLLFLIGTLTLGIGSLIVAWGFVTTVVLPIVGIFLLVAAAVAGLIVLWKNWENISWKVKAGITALLIGLGLLAAVFIGPVTAGILLVTAGIIGIMALIKNWGKITEIFSSVWDKVWGSIKSVTQSVVDFIMPLIEKVIALYSKIKTVVKKVGGFFGIGGGEAINSADDFVMQGGQLTKINPNDTVVGYKGASPFGGDADTIARAISSVLSRIDIVITVPSGYEATARMSGGRI